MASGGVAVDTKHGDMIHDAQFDYYGKRVATCSSDKTIKIHSVGGEPNATGAPLAELRGHEGPVWQVAWAHPKFGVILASCSYDRKVFIWKETNNTWEIIHQYSGHELSVNSVAWAPHEYGLVLACASSDGHISVLSYKENGGTWDASRFPAHTIGANAVSWAPAAAPSSLINAPSQAGPAPRRIVTGGSDKLAKVWAFNETSARWQEEEQLKGHNDWVRDVAWAPSIGLPAQIIASASQDGTVIIWSQEDPSSSWVSKVLSKFPDVVWRVSWSVTGNILAVASGDNRVSLWKEGVDGEWRQIQSIEDHHES